MLLFKGIIIGFGKIIPGVSGAMLAISLNVYDKGIDAISHFFTNTKHNIRFLVEIGLGILIAIIFGSKIVSFSLKNYYLPTMLLFIGLILGGIPSLKNSVGKINSKKIILFLIPLLILTAFYITKKISNNTYSEASFFTIFMLGITDAITMIIPGLSGTAILIMLGYYNLIIEAISQVLSNLHIVLPFAFGIIVGVILLSKVINHYIINYKEYFFSLILGFAFSSIIVMSVNTFSRTYNIITIIISLLLFIVGFKLSNSLET